MFPAVQLPHMENQRDQFSTWHFLIMVSQLSFYDDFFLHMITIFDIFVLNY